MFTSICLNTILPLLKSLKSFMWYVSKMIRPICLFRTNLNHFPIALLVEFIFLIPKEIMFLL